MGGSLIGSKCDCNCEKTKEEIKIEGNPNPHNYNIMDLREIGNFLIAIINYPDCRNYEGSKILVYEGISKLKLVKQSKLDPHFCENKDCISPIARFEPTSKGFEMAEKFCKSY